MNIKGNINIPSFFKNFWRCVSPINSVRLGKYMKTKNKL